MRKFMDQNRRTFAAMLALTGACSVGDEEDLGESSEPVINGTPVATDTLGVPKIVTASGNLCSGTLLTNRAVLTASHCFTAVELANPGRVTVSLKSGGSAVGSQITLHPDEDVAVVRLASALLFNGSTTAHYNPLYSGDPALLDGKNLACFGWGLNTNTTGSGTLRTATLPVDGTSSTTYDLALNASNQMLWKGDSGGPCTMDKDGVHWVTGVHRDCDNLGSVVDWCTDVATTAAVDWIYSHNISSFWPGLFTSDIDAAVVWPNNKAYFFKGSQYIRWDITTDTKDPGFPASISTFWPGMFTSGIDAATVWPNGKAYFFKGSQYIRWDIATDKKDAGFPASISTFWPGLFTSDIDAVAVWPNGKAYFFKGDQYIRWDIATDKIDAGFPAPISRFWKGLYPEGIDAIAMWPNGKAYMFKGTGYERYDVQLDHADLY